MEFVWSANTEIFGKVTNKSVESLMQKVRKISSFLSTKTQLAHNLKRIYCLIMFRSSF